MDNDWKEEQEPEKEEHKEAPYSFLKETFKDEQNKPRRIVGGLFRTAVKGLVFGVVACVAFAVCKPLAESVFLKKQEKVTIPEDENAEEDETVTGEEDPGQGQEKQKVFTVENYREMQKSLTDVATEAGKCVVTVETLEDNISLESKEENPDSVSGVIIWKNWLEVLIAVPARILENEGNLTITFCDHRAYAATLKKEDKNSQIAILSVSTSALKDSTKNQIMEAILGNSNLMSKGMPVITLGNQFGYAEGSGYGIISSTGNYISLADRQYRLLTTDITAAENGSSILFNVDGEVIGIADQMLTGKDSKNLVTGYAISGIKEIIELLSNGNGVPYLGIWGIEVTEEISENQGIPQGIYIKEIEADSPAMDAGIQSGDVIVKMGNKDIQTLYEYQNQLSKYKTGEEIKLTVQRMGAEEYVEVPFIVTVGNKE